MDGSNKRTTSQNVLEEVQEDSKEETEGSGIKGSYPDFSRILRSTARIPRGERRRNMIKGLIVEVVKSETSLQRIPLDRIVNTYAGYEDLHVGFSPQSVGKHKTHS